MDRKIESEAKHTFSDLQGTWWIDPTYFKSFLGVCENCENASAAPIRRWVSRITSCFMDYCKMFYAFQAFSGCHFFKRQEQSSLMVCLNGSITWSSSDSIIRLWHDMFQDFDDDLRELVWEWWWKDNIKPASRVLNVVKQPNILHISCVFFSRM